jgi:hypothetical protein
LTKQSRTKNPPLLYLTLGISLSMLFSACDRNENDGVPNAPGSQTETSPAMGQAFAKELIALKAETGGQKISDEAIAALLSKYKMPNPSLGVHTAPEPALEDRDALAKTAASSIYIPVRKATFDLNMTLYKGYTLEAGAAIEAWTTRTSSNQSVDPLLIAFYRTGGDDIGAPIKVVAMNDDDGQGGLDPDIYWVNNTGAPVGVEIVAYAYSTGTSGTGTLKVRTNLTRSYTGRIGGVNQVARNASSSKPTDGCSNNSDVLILNRNARDAESGFVIGVNYSKMNGAILSSNYEIGGSDQTTVTLPAKLNTGWPDFIVAFNAWQSGSVFSASPYTAYHYQKYSCP